MDSDKSIFLNDRKFAAYLNRAISNMCCMKLQSALDDCHQALRLSSSHSEYALRAMMYALLNQRNEALNDFNTIQQLTSKDDDPHITSQKIGFIKEIDISSLCIQLLGKNNIILTHRQYESILLFVYM